METGPRLIDAEFLASDIKKSLQKVNFHEEEDRVFRKLEKFGDWDEGRVKGKTMRNGKAFKYSITPKAWDTLNQREKVVYLHSQRTGDDSNDEVGWNPLEAAVFYLALKKYGVGSWEVIGYFLPHHNTSQYNTFCQKLFGQQSLALYSGLSLSPYDCYLENALAKGLRKNGTKVHQGPPLSSAQKKANKLSYQMKEQAYNFDIPRVEDRARNYSKLYTNCLGIEGECIKEAHRRNYDHMPHESKADDPFHRSDEWMSEPQGWPKLEDWKIEEEIQIWHGQDNMYPLLRTSEDPNWVQCDQLVPWAWVSGAIFTDLHEKYSKDPMEFEAEDLSIAGLNPRKLLKSCEVRKKKLEQSLRRQRSSKADDDEEKSPENATVAEMEVEKPDEEIPDAKEASEMEVEEPDAKNETSSNQTSPPAKKQLGHLMSWTNEDLCGYLQENGFSQELVSRMKDIGLTGDNIFNVKVEDAETLFANKAEADAYDKAMFQALRTFGLNGPSPIP